MQETNDHDTDACGYEGNRSSFSARISFVSHTPPLLDTFVCSEWICRSLFYILLHTVTHIASIISFVDRRAPFCSSFFRIFFRLVYWSSDTFRRLRQLELEAPLDASDERQRNDFMEARLAVNKDLSEQEVGGEVAKKIKGACTHCMHLFSFAQVDSLIHVDSII